MPPSPVLALTVGVVLALVVVVWQRALQRIVVSIFGLGTLAAAAGLCIWQWGESKELIAGALQIDDLAIAATLVAIVSAAFCIPLSWREESVERPFGPTGHGEFQALLICSVLGMALIAQCRT